MAADARRWKADQRPPREVVLGDRIEDYRLEKKLGQGATGAVHKAYAIRGPLRAKVVAIKIITKASLNTPKRRRRVECEIQLHKSLARHPAIVRFEHAFEDDDSIYILTEFCPGSTLFKYLQDNYPTGLPEDEVRPIFLALVQAVSFLHQNDILHRDLKLTNVLLTDTRQVRIADFGLATKLEDAAIDQEMTMCGTPNYISPEVVRRTPYGMASDIWSLGCMLVALLTGRPPFQGAQVSETLHLVSKGAYKPLPRSASRDVRNLTESILQVDARRRPTTSEILTHPFLIMSQSTRVRDPWMRSDSQTVAHKRQVLASSASSSRRILPKMSPTKVDGLRQAFSMRRNPSNESTLQASEAQAPSAFNFGSSVKNPSRNPWGKIPGSTYGSLLNGLRNRPSRPPALPNEDTYEPYDEAPKSIVDAAIERDMPTVTTNLGTAGCEERQHPTLHSHETDVERDRHEPFQYPQHPVICQAHGLGHRKRFSVPTTSKPTRMFDPARRYSSADALQDLPRHEYARNDTAYASISDRNSDFDFVVKSKQDLPYENAAESSKHSPELLVNRNRGNMRKSTRFAVRVEPICTEEPPEEDSLQVILNNVAGNSKSSSRAESPDLKRNSVSARSETSNAGTYDLVDKYKFDTAGLKPYSQNNKHGKICLHKDGQVTVELHKDERQHMISGDGNIITVTESSGQSRTYSFDDLPAKSLLAYRYASKLIKILRSKVVKIALDSDTARCRLYQNEAFEVILVQQQRKVSFEQEVRNIKIATHDEILWKGQLDEVPALHRDHVRQALIWWARCKDALNESLSEVDMISTKAKGLNTVTAAQSNAKFVDGLGWCEKHDDGKRWNMYFLDGVGLELFTETRRMRLTDLEGKVTEHRLEAGMSNELRHRLKAASKGMQQFVDNNV